jgi:perosamine synthetase
LGYHYRLTDIQAALGISQIKKLEKFIAARLEIAKKYSSSLKHELIQHPPLAINSAWHLYSLQVPANKRDYIYEYCLKKSIGTNTHYQCVYKQPYYKQFNYVSLPNAEKYSDQALSIPIHPKLSQKEQDQVMSTILEALNA